MSRLALASSTSNTRQSESFFTMSAIAISPEGARRTILSRLSEVTVRACANARLKIGLSKDTLNVEANPTVEYRVWGADNIAYGPVELPTLVNWIKQARVPANSWIFKDQEGWARASDLPELKILFKSSLPPKAAAAAETLGIQPGSLRRIKMLADVEDRLLASLLPYLQVVRVQSFGAVVNRGDHGDALFMVLEGEVRARVVKDGHEVTLSTMGVGECFGELAVVDQGPRSADVIANQPTVLIKVSDASLRRMFAEAPALA